ncbi:MAG: SPOR domain-containing protein [Kiloniellales bacterium]
MADMIRPDDIRRIISDNDRRRPGEARASEPLTRRTAVEAPSFDEAADEDYRDHAVEPAAEEAAEPNETYRLDGEPDGPPRSTAGGWIDPPTAGSGTARARAAIADPDLAPSVGSDPQDRPIEQERSVERQRHRHAATPGQPAPEAMAGYDGPALGVPEDLSELDVAELEEAPPRRRRWGLLALGVLVLLVLGAAAVLFGMREQDQVAGVEAPTLKAQVEVDKVRPSVPGGLEVPNRDVQVLDQSATRSEPEAVVLQPPPEEPVALPPVPQAAEPEAAATAAPAPAEDQIAAIIEGNETQDGLTGTAPSADRLAAPGLAIPPRPSAKLDGREAQVAAALEGAAPAADASTAAAAQPAATTEAAASTANQPAASGGVLVQLASLTSAAAAERSWQSMLSRHGAQLSGLTHSVQKIEIEGRGTFFRLRAGPFADRAAAQARCQQLKDKGQACIVVAQ